jgi:hypothetical protein
MKGFVLSWNHKHALINKRTCKIDDDVLANPEKVEEARDNKKFGSKI